MGADAASGARARSPILKGLIAMRLHATACAPIGIGPVMIPK
jgi:hypothetical protein